VTAEELIRDAIKRESDRKQKERQTRQLILALPIPHDKMDAILVELDQNASESHMAQKTPAAGASGF
jgi:hypothetical protein